MTEAAPVFVAGLDHSGKTTMRRALGSHPAIHMVRHLDLWTQLAALHDSGPSGRRRVLDGLTTGRATPLGLDRAALAPVVSDGPFAAVIGEIGRQLCARGDVRRWGLQEALLEFQVARVLRDVPEARIIQLVRDPRGRHQAMLSSGAVGRGGLAAEVAAWVASARAGIAASRRWPAAVRVVRHEDLRDDPASTLRGVCEFIGESFDASMTSEVAAPREEESLSDRELGFIQKHAGPELDALGYPPLTAGMPAAMLPQRLADASRWQLGRLAWRRRSGHLHPSPAREGE